MISAPGVPVPVISVSPGLTASIVGLLFVIPTITLPGSEGLLVSSF